ncbi:undecaprenyl-diphosphatase [Nocardia amikacinitolerans]|uniref:Undecaprenyl-diphosphatase n=1 Tax=Nocardia amikacinitolerans TaxID=756689 RepID=A0A285LRT7_9NOCA|nr:phosphatase PAP2 family protein [Nocardia amikacinitolerans]MCP2276404.1 undecaprenyl-diphosphatase [Nocardia amikacinitolerans]SNY87644.1 undecaprenyl-diphosphatase [Nocardia amikacinitolerans]
MTSNLRRTLPTIPTLVALGVLLAAFITVLTRNVLDSSGLATMDPELSGWAVDNRNGVLTPTAQMVSNCGDTLSMTILTVIVCAALLRERDRLRAVLIAVTGLGAALIVAIAKRLVGRERPPVADRLAVENSLSYPSGHSTGTFVVVGIVAIVLIPKLAHAAARVGAALTAVLFIAAVGASRVYLGVHWPTDVLAGWSIGALWILLCLAVFRYLTLRSRAAATVDPCREQSKSPTASSSRSTR